MKEVRPQYIEYAEKAAGISPVPTAADRRARAESADRNVTRMRAYNSRQVRIDGTAGNLPIPKIDYTLKADTDPRYWTYR